MPDKARRQIPEGEERKVVFLEIVAATAIFWIVVVVLYMVFTYRPA